jgi:hypothetical protein
MALPWMESRNVWAGDVPPAAGARAAEATAPTRLAVLFSGNGFHAKEWWAKGEGESMELGAVLAPLHDFRTRLNFIKGLYNAEALKGNIHSSQTGNILSGAPLASGGEIRSGTSVDQFVAQRHGRSTKVPSLVLGCEKSNASVHKNYSMLYSSHISWTSPTSPTPLEIYPALAFDRLFKDESTREDVSVLDAVREDAEDFRRTVSRSDQRKLDEYLESVRDVERRIESAGKRGELQGWKPVLAGPDMPRPADGVPQDIADHMRLMSDILVLAFMTDATRVCTLKLNNDHSSLRFPNLGVDYMIHHVLTAAIVWAGTNSDQSLSRFIPHLLSSDTSQLLLNSSWLLKRIGGLSESSPITKTLDTMFALSFPVVRLFIMPVAMLTVTRNPQYAKDMGIVRFVFLPLCILQYYWFGKIVLHVAGVKKPKKKAIHAESDSEIKEGKDKIQ